MTDYYEEPRLERQNLLRVEIDPRWRTQTVLDLCEVMRRENDYARLPVLADALMDAGCDSEPLIAACRDEKEPVYAQRIVAIVLGGELADAVKWLEGFAGEWNFSYSEMIENATYVDEDAQPGERGRYGYVVAGGIDLHSRSELDPGDEENFWRCIELLTGKELDGEHRENFGWSCSC